MENPSKATALELQPPVRCFHPRDTKHRFNDALPGDGVSNAIIRGRIETWKDGFDRNRSWVNQLVIGSCFKWVAGLVESTDIPLTPALSRRERGQDAESCKRVQAR